MTSPAMEPTVPSKEIHPATGMVPHVAAKTEAKDRAQSEVVPKN